MPWEFDLLEQDLEARYVGFSQGLPIAWGLAVGAIDNSWTEEAVIRGLDWQGRFYPPGALKVPRVQPQRWHTVTSCCFLVLFETKASDMNEARRVGRPSCRALLALMRREYPAIEPDKALWEGAIVWPRPDKMRMTAALGTFAAAQAKSARILQRVGLGMAKLEAGRFPPQFLQALEWLALARSAKVRPEKFIHLWLAVLSLASFGASRRLGDMRRVRNYTQAMTTGIAGVRSPLAVEELNVRFGTAYKARNRLVHEADDSGITLDLLGDLELAAFELVDFELAKLGMPIVR